MTFIQDDLELPQFLRLPSPDFAIAKVMSGYFISLKARSMPIDLHSLHTCLFFNLNNL